MGTLRVAAIAVLVVTYLGAVAVADAPYTVTVIEAPGWDTASIWAKGINNSGQVVGSGTLTASYESHAFLYDGGVMTDLGALGGSNSSANGINSAGQVVGESSTAGDAATHAFLYSGGLMTDLGTFGGINTCATAINSSGQVVGYSSLAGETAVHAFLYSGGLMTDLGTLGGTTSGATAINSAGQVVGYSTLAGDTETHAFLYSGGQMIDLGVLDGSMSEARGINDAGQVVGYSSSSGHAIVYDGGQMIDLGGLGSPGWEAYSGSYPRGINNAGEIVGIGVPVGPYDYKPGCGTYTPAFVYAGGPLIDLNTLAEAGPGYALFDVYGINDQGQIVAYALNLFGSSGYSAVLTPTPEPATVGLLALGLAGLTIRCKRK